jgi:hypothetical protein
MTMRARDPIVDEVRAARDAIAREFDYDIGRLAEALKRREAESGRKVVSLPAKRIPAIKKTG